MRFFQLLCIFVLGACAVSPTHAIERYLDKRFKDLAATTLASTVVVPGNPCLAWGCPSFNPACAAGTTGPTNVTASGCVVDFLPTTINLNLAPGSNPTIDYFANAQITGSVLDLAGENMNTDFAAYPSSVVMADVNTISINCTVICVSCGAAALQTAGDSMMGFMPPYMFSQLNMDITSITTCMSTAAVNGTTCPISANINAVAGNPPAPCTTNCGGGGGGVSMGIIIGAVVGGVVAVIAIAAGCYLYKKRANSFTTDTRNISSSTATPPVVSGPMSTGGYGGGMGTNYNQSNPSPYLGAQQNNNQMQQMNIGAAAPMNNYVGGYGQAQAAGGQNWNNRQ